MVIFLDENERKLRYKELKDEIQHCDKCSLCKNKENKVIIGRMGKNFTLNTDLLIIGEASGEEEAKEGKPFVGRSGKMLDEWLKILSKNDNYYITNVVKNRPTDEKGKNRVPTDEEINACFPYLERQIELINPKKILCLGNTAFKTLTKSPENLTIAMDKVFIYKDIKVFVFYHPAYVLRNPKSDWQEKLEKLNDKINEGAPKELHGERLYASSGFSRTVEMSKIRDLVIKSDNFAKFPILGIRTDYSFMNFGGKFTDEISYLRENGAFVIGISDDNSTGSFLKLSTYAEESKFKQIYGTTLTKIGVSLMVKNKQGYINLNKITSEINTKDIGDNEIFELIINLNEGLIAIVDSDFNVNKLDYYSKIQKVFNDRFYIGFIPNDNVKNLINYNILKQNFPNNKQIIFYRNYYIKEDDYKLYLVLKSIGKKRKLENIFDDNQGRFLVNYEKVKQIADKISSDEYDKLVENTNEIVKDIDYTIPRKHNLTPKFNFDYGIDISQEEIEKFKEIFDTEGWNNRRIMENSKFYKLVLKRDLSNNIKEYAKINNISIEEAKKVYDDRIKMELDMIYRKEFVDYMLLVKLIVDFADKNQIVYGAGRGSASASIVVYCLGIIKVDALINGLIFSRFLNDFRDIPDIDIDFASKRRSEIIDYLSNVLGKDKVVRASTILLFKYKSALNEIGKAMNIPKYVINDINSKIITRSSGDARHGNIIADTFEFNPSLKKYQEEYKEFFEIVSKVEGIRRTTGTHTSGTMVLDDSYYNYLSLIKGSDGEATSYEFGDMEAYGLIKLDILVLKTLDIVENIVKRHNIKIDYEHPDEDGLNNAKVYKLFKNGYLVGVFEVGTPLMIRLGIGMVENFTDIIALNAIGRPASERNHLDRLYLEFKKTNKLLSYGTNADKILKKYPIFSKYGNLIMFQEQTMLMFTHLAGFYQSDSNIIVKVISKGRGIASFFNQYGKRFIEGCLKNGISEKEATEIFNKLYQFGSYAFNLSHATAYAYNIYFTALLKVKYQMEYYCEILNVLSDDKKMQLYGELENNNIELLTPDINKSDVSNYFYEENKIFAPLTEVKYLSKVQINKIISGRPWNNVEEMIEKLKLPNRVSIELRKLNLINDENVPIETFINETINDNRILIKNKERIIKYFEEKYKIKTSMIKNSEHKIVYVIGQLSGTPRYSNWGDWLTDQTKPTEEQMRANMKVYGSIIKYGWMAKWCKLTINDLENMGIYINVEPPEYAKFVEKIIALKPYSIHLFKIKVKNLSQRALLIELIE